MVGPDFAEKYTNHLFLNEFLGWKPCDLAGFW
ncbi:hypothetical protein FHR50_001573 [Xanthomonas arboricola]